MRDTYEIDNRAAEALAVLDNPMFKEAMAEIRKEYYDQLENAEVGSLTAAAAHASLRVARDFEQRLRSIVNDKKMAAHTRRRAANG